MSLQTLIPIVVKASVLLTVFAIGLRASAQEATYLFRRPCELVRALLAMNVLMPVFALAQANFPEQKLAMAAVLLYLVVNAVVSLPYLLWTRRRQQPVAEIQVKA
jgi:bile acid:Na+ symporter, BASS family